MALIWLYAVVYSIFMCNPSLQQQNLVPSSKVELLFPVGFAVSIPGRCCKAPLFPNFDNEFSNNLCITSVVIILYADEQNLIRVKATCYLLYSVAIKKDREGIRLVAFHSKVNEEFETYQDGGYYSMDITAPKNNRWTYTDRTTRFKIGDVINYWIFVDYNNGRNNVGYTSEFRRFNVTECPRKIMNAEKMCNAPDPSRFEFPNPTVEVLKPKGFKVSIPDQQGIKLFAFHGKINQPFDGREAGEFARDINSPKEGRWTFIDRNTQLVPGDIIYYWLFIEHGNNKGTGRGYIKENLQFVISEDTGSCIKSVTLWNGHNTCSGQLIFEEEFESAAMSNWTREIRYADDPDYEFVIYDKYEQNLFTKDGKLHIKPTLTDDKFGEDFIYSKNGYDLGSSCTSYEIINCYRQSVGGYVLPPIFSGRIVSKHSFKYGRIDIRAKLPKGDWIYPQLFLTPKNYEYGIRNCNSGEIRMAFVTGNAMLSGELQGQVLLGTTAKARAFGVSKLTKLNEAWSDNYHIYSVLWEPNSLIFLVDNTEYGQISPPNGFWHTFQDEIPEIAAKWKLGAPLAPFDQDMVIKLGVGVGGHSFPDTISGKPYTNTEPKPQLKFYRAKDEWKPTWEGDSELLVDYVKVYAL